MRIFVTYSHTLQTVYEIADTLRSYQVPGRSGQFIYARGDNLSGAILIIKRLHSVTGGN